MFNKLRCLKNASIWREQIVLKLNAFEAEMLNSGIFSQQNKEGFKVENVLKLLKSTDATALEDVLQSASDLARAIMIPGITAETIEKLYDQMADNVCENQDFDKTSKLLNQGLFYAERRRIENRIASLSAEMARGKNSQGTMEQRTDLQRLHNRLKGLDRLIMISNASVTREEAAKMYERNVEELRKLGSKMKVQKITNKMQAEDILRVNASIDKEIDKIMRTNAALNHMYDYNPNFETLYGNGVAATQTENNVAATEGGAAVDDSAQIELDTSLENLANLKAEYKNKEAVCAREVNRENENLKRVGEDLRVALQAYNNADDDPIEKNRLSVLIKELDRNRQKIKSTRDGWVQCKTKISDALEGLERLESIKRMESVSQGVTSIEDFKAIAMQISEQTKKSNEELREMEMARNLSYGEEVDTGLSEELVAEQNDSNTDEYIQKLMKEYKIK